MTTKKQLLEKEHARLEAALNEAHAAATAAVIAKGEEDRNALDCGFAWVNMGGMEPLARYCRDTLKKLGGNKAPREAHKKYGGRGVTGWQWWKPGGFGGQAIGHHLAGATAFNEALARNNLRGTVGSRYD